MEHYALDTPSLWAARIEIYSATAVDRVASGQDREFSGRLRGGILVRLKSDPVLWLTGAVLMLFGVVSLVELFYVSQSNLDLLYIPELSLYILTLAALFRGLGRTHHPEENRFWQFIAACFVADIAASTFQQPSSAGTLPLVLEDALYLLSYMAIMWALEFRPDKKPQAPRPSIRRSARISGSRLASADRACLAWVLSVRR